MLNRRYAAHVYEKLPLSQQSAVAVLTLKKQNLFGVGMIKPRCFSKIIFSVHLYVCYKVCYMLKIFSFVGQGKLQTTLREHT